MYKTFHPNPSFQFLTHMNMDLNEQKIGIKVYNNNATPAPKHETLNPSSNPPQPMKRRALTSLLTFEIVLKKLILTTKMYSK